MQNLYIPVVSLKMARPSGDEADRFQLLNVLEPVAVLLHASDDLE